MSQERQAELEKQYFQEARSWEQDRIERLQRAERRAWGVAGAATLVAVMAVGALISLAPLKRVEPFVVRVDNSTGIVDIVTGLEDGQTHYDEAINKYWLGHYLQHRERYLPITREHDRRVVGLFSDPGIQRQYAELTDPRRNPAAPLALYGDSGEVEVKLKNISFISPSVALIRYIKTVERAGQRTLPSHWVATVAFTYKPAPMKEEDRLINPLGFQVTEYRNDPETLQGGL